MFSPFYLSARFRLSPIGWAVGWLALGACPFLSAQTQATNDSSTLPIVLKRSSQIKDQYSPQEQKEQPTFVFGQRISGRPDLDLTIEGEAEFRRAGSVLRADRIDYYQPDDLAKARGNVRINRRGNVYSGPELDLKIDATEGVFSQPEFHLLRNGANGHASRIDFIDDKHSVMRDVSYSTCRRLPEGTKGAKPDWELRAAQLSIDDDIEEGQASNAQLRFKDVPILGLPFFSFPTNDARKSGWLPPTLNLDNVSGIEVVAPYYINLAPNRDATLYPGLMSKRGANLGAEFRYLEREYRGSARLDLMPKDQLRDKSRWGLTANHNGLLDAGSVSNHFDKLGSLNVVANLNRVSDSDYWRDFPRAVGSLNQRLLSNDLNMAWASGNYSMSLRSQKWQILQDANSPITPPYDRLPQLTARYAKNNYSGWDGGLTLDTTRFHADAALTAQPNALRTYALGYLAYPMVNPGSFIRPKLQLHATSYSFDSALNSGAFLAQTSARRVVPSFSLDSGLIFERAMNWRGQNLTQTLEPRAFYTYTPYRDQSGLPLYDTGAYDFNFTSIYSDNAFSGQDRISDNNLLTLGVASRFIRPDSGAELLRLNFAQRLRFTDQRVTLPSGTPDTARISDMLLGATVHLDQRLMFDAAYQYNPKSNQSQRTTLNLRYTPSPYRSLSMNYAFARDTSRQIDVGWQWPLNDFWGDRGQNLGRGQGQGEGRWYSVGRINYSMQDKKLVDGILGFEYDAGCWLSRVVLERLQTTTDTASKRIMLQLEFVGLGRVGTNPLSILRTYVPRYQLLREKIQATPSRFSNYE